MEVRVDDGSVGDGDGARYAGKAEIRRMLSREVGDGGVYGIRRM